MASAIVAAFDFAVSIANENLHAFAPSQHRLVALFNAKVAGVVARAIVVVFLEVVLVHLAYVAKHVGGIAIVVLPQNSLLDEESGESIKFLLKASVVLRRQVSHKRLLRVRRVVGIFPRVFQVFHTLVEFLAGDSECIAEVDGVEGLNVARNHHHIVGGLIEHNQTSVAVVDEPTRRVDGLLHEGVAVGILFIGAVANLQDEQLNYIDDYQ